MWIKDIRDYILYEDKDILVCHKPAGLAVQNARVGSMDMESLLKNYIAQKVPGKMPYLGIIHRLDQPVEGVLVFALNPKAAADLSRQMTAGKIKKMHRIVAKEIWFGLIWIQAGIIRFVCRWRMPECLWLVTESIIPVRIVRNRWLSVLQNWDFSIRWQRNSWSFRCSLQVWHSKDIDIAKFLMCKSEKCVKSLDEFRKVCIM